jgi:hypothetical protein
MIALRTEMNRAVILSEAQRSRRTPSKYHSV